MPENEQAANAINAFRDWVKQNDVEWLAAEQRVYNRKQGYAGTVDAVARVNGVFSVIDFKTSARIYEEYHLQVAAYSKCVEDIYGETVEGAYILRFDKESGEFEASMSNNIDVDFITFCGLLVGYTGLTKLRSRGKTW
jgi:ATP-dependent exoDNAse (exonuclease V) beta subunit